MSNVNFSTHLKRYFGFSQTKTGIPKPDPQNNTKKKKRKSIYDPQQNKLEPTRLNTKQKLHGPIQPPQERGMSLVNMLPRHIGIFPPVATILPGVAFSFLII